MTALISIDHISQVLPALASLRHIHLSTDTKSHSNNHSSQQLIILTKPHIYFSNQQKNLLTTLFNIEPQVTFIFGNELFKQAKWITYLPTRFRAKLLRKKLNQYQLSEIYFAHDNSSDFWNQTLMHAFSQARRYCYGDALGLVYSETYFKQLMYPLKKNNQFLFHNMLARLKRVILYPNKKNQLLAHQATLAIPCDPGGDFFNSQCTLSLVNQKNVKNCVYELSNALPGFKSYMQSLIENSTRENYLFILSNYTESKLTTLDNEIRLYEEILAMHAKPEARIIIKPHPAHNKDIFQQIITVLKKNYCVTVIDKKFCLLPIELASPLVETCTVLSLSYSSISLKYIYNKEIRHVLSNSLIKKYFLIEKLSWVIENNNLYLKLIKEIPYEDKEVKIKDSVNE